MLPPLMVSFLVVGAAVSQVEALVPHTFGKYVNSGVGEAVVRILQSSRDPRCSYVLFLDEGFPLTATAVDIGMGVRPQRTLGMFAAVEERPGNGTQQDWLAVATNLARQVRASSWCVTVVLMTEDPAVLAAFGRLSVKNSLLVASTRFLAVTTLSLRRLENIDFFHKVFSRMDAMVFTLGDAGAATSGGVYIYLPNVTRTKGRIQLAILSSKGFTMTSHLPFFPDKYTRFLRRPVLKVAREWINKIQTNDAVCNQAFIKYLEQGMNFTCTMVYAGEKVYGTKKADGTWSGMIGMLVREEADISVAAFAYTPSRGQVVDYSIPFLVQYSTILAKVGQPKLDPWSFHLPLQSYVWLGIMMTLLFLPLFLVLLTYTSYAPLPRRRSCWCEDVFQLIRVLLQQDILLQHDAWQRRMVTATWMLVALVLVRSYSSNLMSVLAVRYVQQPYQSLRNVLDDPGVTMIWQTNSSRVQYFRAAKSGIYREVAEREKAGGIKFQQLHEFLTSRDTLLRRGDHVLVAVEIITRLVVSNDFTKTGQCDFYTAKERLLPVFLSAVGQKGSPIVPQLSRRLTRMQESGLYDVWIERSIPNATSCAQTPSRITKSSSLSLPHLWGVMVVLAASHVVGLLFLAWEVTSALRSAS